MKDTIQRYYKQVFVSVMITTAYACSNTRYLKEGEMLYTGAEVKIANDSISKKEKKQLQEAVENKLTPKPNSSFLGLRPKLFFYNIAKEPKREKGFNYSILNFY